MALYLPGPELRLADVVLLEALNAYHTATVSKVRNDPLIGLVLTLFRPYVQTADFSVGAVYGSAVICYIGIEEWDVYPGAGEMFTVLERKELK